MPLRTLPVWNSFRFIFFSLAFFSERIARERERARDLFAQDLYIMNARNVKSTGMQQTATIFARTETREREKEQLANT